nr:hypothetical protein [Methanobrevibacter smithii]
MLGSEKIILRHNNRFDNHQLNVIVQEAFDECIEKYCDKPLLDKGEEACRMKVETIFEEYLPLQLKNHGFKSIKINATCSILEGGLFVDKGVCNSVLKNRYEDKILPPCRKCIRKEYDECIVHNIRKDTNLPTTRVVKTIPINLNEKETDETNIKTLKTYFNKRNKSFEDKKTAAEATDNIILNNNNIKNFWVEWGTMIKEGIHNKDILCFFDTDTDKEKFKNLFINHGFILEKTKYGFWITGVKE